MHRKCYPFLILFSGVPWFWAEKLEITFFGLPLWVLNAIVMSVLASITIAILLSDKSNG